MQKSGKKEVWSLSSILKEENNPPVQSENHNTNSILNIDEIQRKDPFKLRIDFSFPII